MSISIYSTTPGKGSQSAADLNPSNIVAEQHVLLGKDTFACQFDHDFAKALEHRNKGEISAMSQITLNEALCVSSYSVKPGQEWTVLSVRPPLATIGITNVVQSSFDEKNSERRGKSYTTFLEWITPIAAKP